MSQRPNILLITADQWRGDCLGIAGHPQVQTPNTDALAREGTYFSRHYAATAPCSPARASLYTGLYQMNHRVLANGSPLDDRFDNVARAARRAGYLPTLFGYTDTSADPRCHDPQDPVLTSYEGILPGFIAGQLLLEDDKTWLAWLKERGYTSEQLARIHHVEQQGEERISLAPTLYGADETPTAFLTGAFLSWRDQQSADQPWFAHVSYLRPHPPICVPEPFNRMYEPDASADFAGAPTPDEEAEVHPLLAALQTSQKLGHHIPGADGPVRDLTRKDLARIRALYYGMISEVDHQLGRLLEGLKAAGDYDNTLIILTSDHAEMMGDHWLLGKAGFHEQSYHVPLVIKAPGESGGHVVDAFTSAVDVFPTLLDVLGIRPGHQPDGCSLLPFTGGETPEDWRDAVLWEYSYRQLTVEGTQMNAPGKSLISLRAEAWQYVHCPELPDLFLAGLPGAPLEPVPLDMVPAARRIECMERLLAARMTLQDETLCHAMVWSFHADR
ncbi:sulfatase-like hydrolase/transferase [Roseibium sp. CAU 1637]|uniref:Sulfatase-like hydrolase/transferase n=1 Tax=Roseibium limicola TaxID=2816037 RepID=A0A939ERC5_9HYPH|nr:sulfatase-like hydrolase/transferase [Roseibium limicola]MBO0346546.1 sulfatase-like hydrolase/transferase [Roseibium limicola]